VGKLLNTLRIPYILNEIRVLFGKQRRGYYKMAQREISMNDKGIFLDDTLVFKRVESDTYNICSRIGIEELVRIETWLSLKYCLTPWTSYDPAENGRYYTISFMSMSIFSMRSLCHLKVNSSFIDQNSGTFLKKVFVDTL
jgi:hypothetical protein